METFTSKIKELETKIDNVALAQERAKAMSEAMMEQLEESSRDTRGPKGRQVDKEKEKLDAKQTKDISHLLE